MDWNFVDRVKSSTPSQSLRFAAHSGSAEEVIPQMLADNRTLIDVQCLIWERMNRYEGKKDWEVLRNNAITTITPYFVHPSGSGEIVVASYRRNAVARECIDNYASRLDDSLARRKPLFTEKEYETIKKKEYDANKKQGCFIIPPEIARHFGKEYVSYDFPEFRANLWAFLADDFITERKYERLLEQLWRSHIHDDLDFPLGDDKIIDYVLSEEFDDCDVNMAIQDHMGLRLPGGGREQMFSKIYLLKMTEVRDSSLVGVNIGKAHQDFVGLSNEDSYRISGPGRRRGP